MQGSRDLQNSQDSPARSPQRSPAAPLRGPGNQSRSRRHEDGLFGSIKSQWSAHLAVAPTVAHTACRRDAWTARAEARPSILPGAPDPPERESPTHGHLQFSPTHRAGLLPLLSHNSGLFPKNVGRPRSPGSRSPRMACWEHLLITGGIASGREKFYGIDRSSGESE